MGELAVGVPCACSFILFCIHEHGEMKNEESRPPGVIRWFGVRCDALGVGRVPIFVPFLVEL